MCCIVAKLLLFRVGVQVHFLFGTFDDVLCCKNLFYLVLVLKYLFIGTFDVLHCNKPFLFGDGVQLNMIGRHMTSLIA